MSKKNPYLAAFFSLIIAGLGQFYVERFWRGVFFLSCEVVTAYYYLMVEKNISLALNLFVSVWAAADAYRLAKKTGEPAPKTQPEQELFV